MSGQVIILKGYGKLFAPIFYFDLMSRGFVKNSGGLEISIYYFSIEISSAGAAHPQFD